MIANTVSDIAINDALKAGTIGELIVQLKAVTEGSRTLDCAIRDTLDLPSMLVPPDGGNEAYPYTTSIDAALSFVPKGWPRAFSDDCGMSLAKATVCVPDDDGIHIRATVKAEAATPALAFCIAALTARVVS